jgi:hypothetical protein
MAGFVDDFIVVRISGNPKDAAGAVKWLVTVHLKRDRSEAAAARPAFTPAESVIAVKMVCPTLRQ